MDSQQPVVGGRYYREHAFDVHYFPAEDTEANEEMHEVGDTLYEALEYITLGEGLIRGTGMRYEVIDNVLHFFVSYNLFLMRKKDSEAMEELEIIQGVTD